MGTPTVSKCSNHAVLFRGVEVTSALGLVLDVQLRGCAADALSAMELVNDALQEVRFCFFKFYCSMLK
jgi:hypothetical protein